MTIGIRTISSSGSRNAAGSMKMIEGVNALFFGVCTGNSCVIAAAQPKIAKMIQPCVSVERRETAGSMAAAAVPITSTRYAFAARESRFSPFAATVVPCFMSFGSVPRELDYSTQLDSVQLNSTQLDSVQLDSTQLDSTQLDSTQLDSTQLDSVQLEFDRA